MKGLPWNWKRTLRRCNLLLARREMAEFFQMAKRIAEVEDAQVAYRTEFVVGWERFAADPCYKTAVSFLKGAREGAPLVFQYFEGSCPGGHLYQPGIETAASFSLGDYSLDMALESLAGLTELSDREYEYFPRQLRGEIIYHAPPAEFLGYDWGMMIGMIKKELYKLAASLELDDQRNAVELMQGAFKYCEIQLGTPTDEKQGLFVWDTTDGNVILQTVSVMGTAAINMFVTSSSIRGMPRC